jgi:hypothetical protein
MRINMKGLCVVSISMMLVAALTISCKKTWDAPPVTGAPNVVANTTIKDLKAMFTVAGSTVPITSDLVIRGVVNLDDRSGNYYQQISIQDSTGGILLRLAGSNLYTSYPKGREVFVKLKGLVLGDYNKMIQLGGGVDSVNGGVTLLAANLQPEHIIKGALNQPLTPKVVSFSQLTNSMQDPYIGTLVRFEGVEFATGDLGKNYADATTSGNRTVQACTSPTTNKITLRTSNYSSFATLPVAQGNGYIDGVYSIFGSTKQLTIGDTSDVQFKGTRCGVAPSTGGITLSTSPYTINFNNIATALPAGISVVSGATATTTGTAASFMNTANTSLWNKTAVGFKNFASATGLTAGADSTAQVNSTNRALGVRQTSSAGFDPGAAFVIQLDNTTGKSNLKMDFLLQSLDTSSSVTRTTTWSVDYAIGDNPTSFTTVTPTGTPVMTTGNKVFSSTPVSVTFPAALNNVSQKIWIRIVTLSGTTGSNNRPSTAIDDLTFTWN